MLYFCHHTERRKPCAGNNGESLELGIVLGLYDVFTQVSHVNSTRPEMAEAPRPGRALKKFQVGEMPLGT